MSESVLRRYWLMRHINGTGPRLGWVMLNPSTADDDVDDPTIRKVKGFTEREGYGTLVVCNLYSMRATDPAVLRRALDIAKGPRDDDHLRQLANECVAVVVAWGSHANHVPIGARAQEVMELLRALDVPLYRIGPLLKGGHPRHPLYAPYRYDLEVHG